MENEISFSADAELDAPLQEAEANSHPGGASQAGPVSVSPKPSSMKDTVTVHIDEQTPLLPRYDENVNDFAPANEQPSGTPAANVSKTAYMSCFPQLPVGFKLIHLLIVYSDLVDGAIFPLICAGIR